MEEQSRWHRAVDADEIWNWFAGSSLLLSLSGNVRGRQEISSGANIVASERSQAVVPKGIWQSVRPRDGWALVGCVVAPAVRFEAFEIAPDGWEQEHG